MLLCSFAAGGAAVWAAQRSGLAEGLGQPGATEEPPSAGSVVTELPKGSALIASPTHTGGRAAGAVPAEAAAFSSLLSAELSARYRQWARTDPAAFLEELKSPDSADGETLRRLPSDALLDALRLASEADPELVLEAGEGLGGTLGLTIRSAALEALAARDPEAALDYLEDIDAGDMRERFLASIATGFARADLDGAVRWLSTLTDGDGAAFYPVIDAVAIVDLGRAIELDLRAIELDLGGAGYGDTSWLRSGLLTNRASPARIADQLVSVQFTGLLSDALGFWAIDDPYGAIAWIQSQETISASVVSRLASELAIQDYGHAMSLAAQFSPAVRAAWTQAAIGSAASFDVLGALDTLEAFRDAPFHDNALAQILRAANDSLGPAETARIAGESPPRSVAGRIAVDWAPFDPRAAADWASSIEDEAVRFSTVQSVIYAWWDSDPGAAETWTRGIADAELRERTLNGLCLRNTRCRSEL